MNKGLSGWVEIAKGGIYRDSKNREQDTNTLIDKAVASFNLAEHEPPIVCGHPKDNAPAFGWVSGLRAVEKNGAKILEATFSQVPPEFADLVEKGLYKKRSASFYPDGSLKHVGFLGAVPPAIKGLRNIEFSGEDDAITIELGEYPGPEPVGMFARLLRGLREWIIEKDGREAADRVIPQWELEDLESAAKEPAQEFNEPIIKEEAMSWKNKVKEAFGKAVDDMPEGEPAGTAGISFSEADIEKARKEAATKAAKEAREQATAEFAEKEAKAHKEAHKKAIGVFITEGVKAGKIPPAWKDAGLQEFMEQLDSTASIEFAEGQEKTPAAWFQTFLESLPKAIDFGEIATRDKDVGAGCAGAKLEAIIQKKMKENKVDYDTAFSEAQAENPSLAMEYLAEIG